jgi:hypothetical protein
MGLTGDVKTMELAEVLQWISSGRKTGTLHVRRRSIEKAVVFRDGAITSSWSNHPRECLGQFLIRDRRISEEQLFRALLLQESERRLLGSILVDSGVLDEDGLRHALKTKAEETIYDLFLWPEGQFEFRDNELLPGVTFELEIAVTGVILEGMRRLDEWVRIKAVLPSMGTTFRVPSKPPPEGALERHALALAASGKSLAEIALELRRSDFDAAAVVFELLTGGYLSVDTAPVDPEDVDTVDALRRLLSLGDERLAQKRHDAALAAYEAALNLDRLNQRAKKGQIAVEEARAKDRKGVGQAIMLNQIPVLAVDLAKLTRETLDPHEGFVLSRINGQWDVQSILKICPLQEADTMLIFFRLLGRQLIALRDPAPA